MRGLKRQMKYVLRKRTRERDFCLYRIPSSMHKPGINIDERRGSRVDGSVEVERRETPTNYLEIEDGHLSKIHLTRYFPYFC